MRALFSVLMSMLLLVGPAAHAQGQSRDDAAQALSDADPRLRREAADRLGEIGTMGDLPMLVRALRDVDEDTRDHAEQAMWRIFGALRRCGHRSAL